MVGIAITRQSQANDLEISDGVRAAIKEINAGLPKGTQIGVSVDYTEFTRHAIQEVWITMAISLAMVALVNFLFLGTARAAIIPTDRRADLHPVDLHRAGPAGLLDQPADPAGPGAGHRPGGR